MNTEKFSSNAINLLLNQKKIATMDELKLALNTQAPATVFRKLKELDYLTSYSHGGRYYTLKSNTYFNNLGLWSFNGVNFSKYGTLLNTLVHYIEQSESGLYHKDINQLLPIDIRPSLHKLFKQNKIDRKKYLGLYLYCSADPVIKKRQLTHRQSDNANQGTRAIVMSDDWVSNEIKAAIILYVSLLDEKQRRLFAGLESLQFGHGGDNWIAQLLNLDPHTVAKGRRQLLEHDIQYNGVRASGAVRHDIKKNT